MMFASAFAADGHAETNIFKSSKFLTWPEENRSFYIRTSIGMAGLIALKNDKAHAKCIEDWYNRDTKKSDAAIEKVMRKYPDYHPRGVILGVLHNLCGSFDYKKR